ncbi:MAG: thioredoxin domain-containing protein [Dehalococcoidia bacterium]
MLVIGVIVAVGVAIAAIAAIPRGDEPPVAVSGTEAGQLSERYQPYSAQALADAGPDDTVVLFFSAVWCSTCKVLRDDIAANQDAIPDDVRILIVDFDDSTELKQRYGVVYQHTLVQVDRTGRGIARWELSRSLAELLATIIEV